MKWRWKRKKNPKKTDPQRHLRVEQRLLMRLREAAAEGDIDRVRVLYQRIQRVRDIQIDGLGR